VNSILYIVSAVASPLFGLLVDKTGRNILWVFTAILVTIGAHGLLAFTFLDPYIGMCIMGLSYSLLASALWPMVALVIPDHQLGTAYGL
jgi:MFS family permease